MKLISIIFLVSIWLNAQTLNLVSGWNVVALQSDTNVSSFKEKFPQITNLFRYDGKWHTDGNIKSSEGIWAYVDKNTSINVTPSTIVKNDFEDIYLYKGWNLAGLVTPYSIHPRIFNEYKIFRYNNSIWSSDNKDFIDTGEAFWIKSDFNKTINLSSQSAELHSFTSKTKMLEHIQGLTKVVNYNKIIPTYYHASNSFTRSQKSKKTDLVSNEDYIFYLLPNSNSVYINSFKRLSQNLIEPINKIELDMKPNSLMIKDKKLLLVYSEYEDEWGSWESNYVWHNKSHIELYNINYIDNIIKVGDYDIDGNIVEHDIIGDNIFIISRFASYIDYASFKLLPTLKNLLNSTTTQLLKPNTFFATNKTPQRPLIITISMFNVKTLEYKESISLNVSDANVYLSKNAYYITTQNFPAFYSENIYKNQTTIYKIGLKEKLSYKGKVTLEGQLLNHFAMDEYKSILRVATSNKDNWREADNHIYTIESNDENFTILSKLSGLGKSKFEGINFLGDMAHIITKFHPASPLQTIDLSDVTEPKNLGEFKFKGILSYFHPINEKYTLSLGKNTTPVGLTKGIQLQLFEINNTSPPKLIDEVIIGDLSTYSLALDFKKAFTYRHSDQTFAIPIVQGLYYNAGIELGELLSTTQPFTSNDPSFNVSDENNIVTDEFGKVLHGLFVFRIKDEKIVPLTILDSSNKESLHKLSDRSSIFSYDSIDYAFFISGISITIKKIPN